MLFFRALTISVTRAACCTMTLKTNVFKCAGHWHEGGSNVFKSFLSTPKGFTWHNAFIRQKCWYEEKHSKPTSPLSDKHYFHGLHGFDRKVVSPIWIVVVVMHCCLWAHTFLDADRHLPPVTEVMCFRTIHTIVRYSSPLLWASSLVRQESTLHSTSGQSQTWEREREWRKEWGPLKNGSVSSISPMCHPLNLFLLRSEGLLIVSVAVWAYLSLLHLKFHNLHWESTCVFHFVNVCFSVCVNAQGGRKEPPRTKAPLFSEQLASLKRTSLPPLAAPRAPHHSIVHIIQLYTPHTLPSLFSLPEISLFLLCNQSAFA